MSVAPLSPVEHKHRSMSSRGQATRLLISYLRDMLTGAHSRLVEFTPIDFVQIDRDWEVSFAKRRLLIQRRCIGDGLAARLDEFNPRVAEEFVSDALSNRLRPDIEHISRERLNWLNSMHKNTDALYLWHREALAAKALYIRATGHGQFSTLREAENAKRALHNTRIPKFLHVDDLPSFELEST